MQLKTQDKTKRKRLPEPLEALEEQQKQKSAGVKEPLPPELVKASGQPLGKKKKKSDQDLLGQYKIEEDKARQKHLRRLRQQKAELIAASKDLEKEEEERKKKMAEEEEEKKRREAEGEVAPGEVALAQTGASAKQPMGIFGLGKKKKRFKKATAERRVGPSK